MKILGVDSSATAASVAIMEDERLIGEFFINTKLTHSQTLIPMINELLTNTNTSLSDIDVLAVNTGPGSFTGVRIGVCAVKGLAMPQNKPCASVSTLKSMAHNLSHIDCIVCAVMDARCNQVYNALFDCENGEITRLCDDRALKIDELKQEVSRFSKKVYLVGDGAKLCFESFSDLENIVLAPEILRYQRASGVCKEAMKECSELLTPACLMPRYLRLPQAQRELKKRMEENK